MSATFTPETGQPGAQWPAGPYDPTNPGVGPGYQDRPPSFPPPPPLPAEPSGSRPPEGGGRSSLRAALAGGMVGALVAGLVSFGTVRLTDDAAAPATSPAVAASVPVSLTTAPDGTSSGEVTDIHALIAKVEPSVVSIEVGVAGRDGTVQQVAAGSGVVISDDGLVLTNAHVVDLTDQLGRPLSNAVVTVRLSDGSERGATVLGTSPANDIALVRVQDTSGLEAATLGDSDALRVGDEVIAIGNALDLGDTPTVTKGIVSAKDRSLDVDANTTLEDLIQTDAPINHGNSGGALVNAAGEVIGINSAGIPDAQNVGFAIAVNSIKPLLDQLEQGEQPATQPVAFLGVSTEQSVDGVTVTGVTQGSAADEAGIQAGDVIVKLGDETVATTADLGGALRELQPGARVTITIERGGATQTVDAQLGSRNQ